MFKVSIPKISDKELKELYQQIKPVVTKEGKLYYLREYTFEELSLVSYFWNRSEDVRKEVEKGKLEAFEGRDFVCLHEYGHPALFKPSVREVLSQIDREILSFVKAFEIIDFPKTADDFYKDSFTSIAFDNGYHVSTVRLYREKY